MAVIKQHGIYFLTGSLRSGKGLTAVSKIREMLLDGRKVATNMDLKLEHMLPADNKTAQVIRVPDQPTIDDLEAIGLGYDHPDPEHYDESKFGLLVLDELATFLNARSWNDKGRKAFIDWLLMSGKKRWVLMLTIQDLELLDKQIRAALASQYVVTCKSMAKYTVPVISPVFKLFTGRPLTLPKSYMGVVRVGTGVNAPVVDRWLHYGTALYSAYNTAQVYLERDNIHAKQLCTMLPPWYIKGRYLPKKDLAYFRKWLSQRLEYVAFSSVIAAFFSLLGFVFSSFTIYTSATAGQINKLQSQLLTFQNKINQYEQSYQKTSFLVESKKNECLYPDRFRSYRISGSFSDADSHIVYLLTDGRHHFKTNEDYLRKAIISPVNKCNFSMSFENCSYQFSCLSPLPSPGALPAGPAGFGREPAGEGSVKDGSVVESGKGLLDSVVSTVQTAL